MITQHPDFKNFIDRGSRAFYGKTIEEMEQEKRKMEHNWTLVTKCWRELILIRLFWSFSNSSADFYY